MDEGQKLAREVFLMIRGFSHKSELDAVEALLKRHDVSHYIMVINNDGGLNNRQISCSVTWVHRGYLYLECSRINPERKGD